MHTLHVQGKPSSVYFDAATLAAAAVLIRRLHKRSLSELVRTLIAEKHAECSHDDPEPAADPRPEGARA